MKKKDYEGSLWKHSHSMMTYLVSVVVSDFQGKAMGLPCLPSLAQMTTHRLYCKYWRDVVYAFLRRDFSL